MSENNVQKVMQLIDQGVHPIIRFVRDVDPGSYELHQLTKVYDYKFFDDDETVWVFKTDFSEFVKLNQSIAVPNYYDRKQNPCLKWHETSSYPRYFRTDYYVGLDSSDEFEIIEDTSLFDEFQKSSETSYIKWLESKLRGIESEN